MKGQNAGVWGGLVIFLYALVMFLNSFSLGYYTRLGPGPGFFPLWINGILLFLSLGYILFSLKKEVILFKQLLPKGKDLISSLSVPAAILAFMLIVHTVGFVVACTVLIFTVMVLQYKWYSALGISLSVSVILFVVFQYLLKVALPVNSFGW